MSLRFFDDLVSAAGGECLRNVTTNGLPPRVPPTGVEYQIYGDGTRVLRTVEGSVGRARTGGGLTKTGAHQVRMHAATAATDMEVTVDFHFRSVDFATHSVFLRATVGNAYWLRRNTSNTVQFLRLSDASSVGTSISNAVSAATAGSIERWRVRVEQNGSGEPVLTAWRSISTDGGATFGTEVQVISRIDTNTTSRITTGGHGGFAVDTGSFESTDTTGLHVGRVQWTELNAVASPTIALAPSTLNVSGIVGGANPAGQSVSITNAGGGTLSGLQGVIRYASGQAVGWLQGAVNPATAPSTATFTFVTTGLPAGSYQAYADIESGVASNSPQRITINLTMTAPPVIGLSTQSVTVGAQQNDPSPNARSVLISNTGDGSLTGLGATVAGGPLSWLTPLIDGSAAPPDRTLALGFDITGLAVGQYTATVRVTSTVPGVAPADVTVTLNVTAAPAPIISLRDGDDNSVASIGWSVEERETGPARNLFLKNAGSGSLTGLATTIVGAPAWLAVALGTPTFGATPVAITPNFRALPPGTHTATLRITSTATGVTNSPRDIPVTVVVRPAIPNRTPVVATPRSRTGRLMTDAQITRTSSNSSVVRWEASELVAVGVGTATVRVRAVRGARVVERQIEVEVLAPVS